MTEQMMSEGAAPNTGDAQPDASSSGDWGVTGSSEPNPLAFNRDILPEDLRLEPSLQSFDSVDKLAKSYVHAVRKLGVPADELVRMPKEMSAEQQAEIYERLGRPNSADEYVLDIGRVKPQFSDVIQHLPGEVIERSVDQDQPCARLEKVGAHSSDTYVVKVVENLERLLFLRFNIRVIWHLS